MIKDEKTNRDDFATPVDINYFYSGYAPIMLRFVEKMLPPYNTTGFSQKVMDPDRDEWFGKIPYRSPTDEASKVRYVNDLCKDKKKTILLYFIGGVTYSEISAVNYLSKKYTDKQFLVATTQTLNMKKVINSMKEKDE